MNIEEVRLFCLSIKGSSEHFPFDETTLVFKVMDKMFAFMSLESNNGEFRLNLKCDPERAVELREAYEGIIPGYHSNKKYWNTIILASDVADNTLRELICHSVDEVIKKLSKVKQEEYRSIIG